MDAAAGPPPLRTLAATFLGIGLASFGGPAGQIAVMHRVLVDERKWLDEPRFLHALNYCMLLPGPEAQQLACYAGWLLRGQLGGVIAGALFVLPGALAMWLLCCAYVQWQGSAVVEALAYGLKAAVIAVVAAALVRVARRALTRRWRWLLATGAFLALALLSLPFPAVIAGAAVIGGLM
ncbi:MAG: chromate transporter, partial [Planctomycetes bacterium]|nr:chromate transporter [Planctomycetota bacterium]